jgi:hypothetical protein
MKHLSLTFPSLLFLILLMGSGCKESSICQRGSGELEVRTLSFEAIDGLTVSGETTVILRQGSTQSVQVETYPNVFDAMDFRVAGGLLITDLDGCWNRTDLVIYLTIATPLTQVEVSGAGEVQGDSLIVAANQLDLSVSGSGRITLDLEANDLNSRISGSGSIVLMGTAQDQTIRVSGSGDYEAFNLIAESCDADVSGSGQVEVYVNGRLDAKVSGSGDIRYAGNPTSVNTNVTGSGSVAVR